MSTGATVRLKICGMRDADNIAEVAALKPDYMGFIFYDKSPRYVGESLSLAGANGIKKVGVFVNADVASVVACHDRYALDYVQLHGNEPVSDVRELRRAGARIIKAFAVDEAFDFSATRVFAPHVDFFLFDTKGKYHGGNAIRFDWSLLKKYDQQIPFFLSGGLTPENVNEALQLKGLNLHALDVNSGVEVAPGRKNIDKVQQILMAVQDKNENNTV